MKAVIREITWLTREAYGMDFGFANGYVLIPKGHFLHGTHYDNIAVDVHGGLTYSNEVTEEFVVTNGNLFEPALTTEDIGAWMVGFDTAHGSDTLQKWPKTAVIAETENLKTNLLNKTE